MSEEEACAMNNVFDVTERIAADRAIERYARLWELLERTKAELARNPTPFLDRAAHEVARHQQFIAELRRVVMPPVLLDDAYRPWDMRDDLVARLDAVERLVNRGVASCAGRTAGEHGGVSGFDDDWRCPNHTMRGGSEQAYCPEGGCSLRHGCARDKQQSIALLTGVIPQLEDCAEP